MKEEYQTALDGAYAIGYVILLIGSAPVVPSLWFFLERHFQWSHFLPQLVAGLFVIILLRTLPKRFIHVFFFLFLTGLFFFSMGLIQRPIERIHFIEYGALSYFFFKWFRHFKRVPCSYAVSVLGTFGVGVLDEWIQGFLPNRIYDTRDIWINLWAGSLGMALVACITAPHSL